MNRGIICSYKNHELPKYIYSEIINTIAKPASYF